MHNGGVPEEPRPSPTLETWLGDTLDALAIVVAIGLVAASIVASQGVPRILLALGFLLFVPGRAITANWADRKSVV